MSKNTIQQRTDDYPKLRADVLNDCAKFLTPDQLSVLGDSMDKVIQEKHIIIKHK